MYFQPITIALCFKRSFCLILRRKLMNCFKCFKRKRFVFIQRFVRVSNNFKNFLGIEKRKCNANSHQRRYFILIAMLSLHFTFNLVLYSPECQTPKFNQNAKVLLKGFHLNGHTIGFHPQI